MASEGSVWRYDRELSTEIEAHDAAVIGDAAARGDLNGVVALLQQYPNLVFSKDSEDRTPLHWAAFKGQKEVAQKLLANGADANAKEIHGFTPLHAAANSGDKDIAELLLAYKADANVKESHGFTPLHFASAAGKNELVALLLTGNADVNATDNQGDTSLHLAAMKGHKDIAKLLLAHGADVNAHARGGGHAVAHRYVQRTYGACAATRAARRPRVGRRRLAFEHANLKGVAHAWFRSSAVNAALLTPFRRLFSIRGCKSPADRHPVHSSTRLPLWVARPPTSCSSSLRHNGERRSRKDLLFLFAGSGNPACVALSAFGAAGGRNEAWLQATVGPPGLLALFAEFVNEILRERVQAVRGREERAEGMARLLRILP